MIKYLIDLTKKDIRKLERQIINLEDFKPRAQNPLNVETAIKKRTENLDLARKTLARLQKKKRL